MKKAILFITLFATLFTQSIAQNNITLNINHKLGAADFAMNQAAKNNMDHDFKVTRLEYYISEISLIHDGGTETLIEDLWVLARAHTPTEIELGAHDINTVEKIKLHIGVNSDQNHLDPSAYPSSHPLAPKSPSMHWGWTAGYRFVAMEGYGGTELNQLFQLHGLGDPNYFTTEIDINEVAENNQLTLNLNADYNRALENISVKSGVIVHGENLQAKQCLENFRDFVFSPSGFVSSTIDFSEVNKFNTFPNPVSNGTMTIELDLTVDKFNCDLSLTSADGRQLQFIESVLDGQKIDVSELSTGLYFITLSKEGQNISAHKIFIK